MVQTRNQSKKENKPLKVYETFKGKQFEFNRKGKFTLFDDDLTYKNDIKYKEIKDDNKYKMSKEFISKDLPEKNYEKIQYKLFDKIFEEGRNKIKKLPNHKTANTQLYIGKKQVMYHIFDRGNEDNDFDRKDIEDIVDLLREKLLKEKKDTTRLMVSVLDPYDGWRSGRAFGLDEEENIYNGGMYGRDNNSWRKFVVYELPYVNKNKRRIAPPKNGGNTKNNDCLYIAILRHFGHKNNLPKRINNGYKLKKFLKLERDENVPISMIPKLEDKLKCKINVEGDYELLSNKVYTNEMTIVINDGHYELKTYRKKTLLYGISPIIRQPLIHDFKNGLQYTEEKGVHKLDIELINTIKNERYTSKYFPYGIEQGKTLEETFNDLCNDRNSILEATGKKIDLFKTSGNTTKAGLLLFNNDIVGLEEAETITEYEELWIISCNNGGIIFNDNNDNNMKDVICYDVNSKYPDAMCKISVPMKRGTFYTLDKFENEYFDYGIYRCKIEHTGDYMIDRLFKLNSKNFYTFHDLTVAKELGMKIELIQDGEPNFLSYKGKLIRGELLFGKTIKYLYELKRLKIPRAKAIISSLWGALCQKNVHTYIDKAEINEDEDDIDKLYPSFKKDGTIQHNISYCKRGHHFLHSYGRIMPFLTSYVRRTMVKDILPNNEHIIRVYVDSILSTKPLDFKLSDKLGDYKIEKEKSGFYVGSKNSKVMIDDSFKDIYNVFRMLYTKN